MRTPTTLYRISRFGGEVSLVRISEPHVHTPACYHNLGTARQPVMALACGQYDAGELARMHGHSVPVLDVRAAITPTASYRLRDHSHYFDFGSGAAAAAQLALAILLDCLEDADRARRHYQDFKWHVVATWKADSIEISAAEIIRFVEVEEINDAAFAARIGSTPASAGKAVL
jgi:hypothetical protein